MTSVPLPEHPCVRVRLVGEDPNANTWGSRFYLGYSGSAPTGANCTTLATDIQSAWVTHLESLLSSNALLTEVDVLDIATDSGFSGQASGNLAGTRSGASLPAQVAMNIEYGIARRYRGGKPRGYWPFGVDADMNNPSNWTAAFITEVTTKFEAFITDIEALSVGAIGTLSHVNLSYYEGFVNHTGTSGRSRAVPQYRAVAKVDTVTGYFPKTELSSQRRRRTSTTP